MTGAPDLDGATAAVALARGVVASATARLVELGGVDENQTLAYELAHVAAGTAVADAALRYGEHGPSVLAPASATASATKAHARPASLGPCSP